MGKIVQSEGTKVVLWNCCAALLIIAASTTFHFGENFQRISAAEFPAESVYGEFDWVEFDWIDEFYEIDEFDGIEWHKKVRGSRLRADGTERNVQRRQGNSNRTPRSQRIQSPDADWTEADWSEWDSAAEWFELYLMLSDPTLYIERMLMEESPFYDPALSLEAIIEALIAEAIFNQSDINQGGTDWAPEPENVARVVGIEYSVDGINFSPVTDTLYIPVGTEVTFRAVPTRGDAALPASRLTWSGATRDSGDSTLARITSNTASRSATTPTLITVSCGTSSATASVIHYDMFLDAYLPFGYGRVQIGVGNYRVPIMLNDVQDFDGMVYAANWNCAAHCPAGASCDHRPFEPVFGLNYVGPLSHSDPNLMEFLLFLYPRDLSENLTGSIEVNITGNTGPAPTIRVWKIESERRKGIGNIIHANPPTINVNGSYFNLFYVEGIHIGDANISATYTPPQGAPVTADLPISVVSLVERQNGMRRVINDKGSEIQFTVENGAIFNGNIFWTVGGYTNSNIRQARNHKISVSYGHPTPSSNPSAGQFGVNLPEDANHRRFERTVTAKIADVIMTRTVRVAQDTFQGTPVPIPTQVQQRRTQVRNLATIPNAGMDPLPVNTWNPLWLTPFSAEWFDDRFNTSMRRDGNTVMQYGFTNHDGAFGMVEVDCSTSGSPRSLYVYGAMVFSPAYSAGLKEEDLRAVALHERRHVEQLAVIRVDNLLLNPWKRLDSVFSANNGPGVRGYRNFLEADAHAFGDFAYSGTSWRLMIHDLFLPQFIIRYRGAMAQYECTDPQNPTRVPDSTKDAARSILQGIYNSHGIFPEMRRWNCIGGTGAYDITIRAPKP